MRRFHDHIVREEGFPESRLEVLVQAESRDELTLSRFTPGSDGPISACCPVCDHGLELQQPDRLRPERLLALCGECDGWFLLDLEHGLFIHLPVIESL